MGPFIGIRIGGNGGVNWGAYWFIMKNMVGIILDVKPCRG